MVRAAHLIHREPYAVDHRLAQLGLTRALLALAAERGHLDRLLVPPYGFPGQDEYDAASRALSTIIEQGGATGAGWHRGALSKIPVALNADRSIAVTCTPGAEGTGRVDGEPRNKALKGPATKAVSKSVAQMSLDMDDPDNLPVDFWFYFTRFDADGLWAELYSPVMGDDGYAIDFHERVLLGRISGGDDPAQRRVPEASSPPDISIARKSG
jgi:hypothetical protein